MLSLIMISILTENKIILLQSKGCLVMKMMLISTVIVICFTKVNRLCSTLICIIFYVYKISHNFIWKLDLLCYSRHPFTIKKQRQKVKVNTCPLFFSRTSSQIQVFFNSRFHINLINMIFLHM